MQGVEAKRAFSLVIDERTGMASFAVAMDGLAMASFGACTPMRRVPIAIAPLAIAAPAAAADALPRPWSVGIVNYWQTQDYDIVEASIGIGDEPLLDLDVEGSVAYIDVKSVSAKLGLWLLPFLNVTGTVGYNIIETDIHLPKAPIGINPPPRPGEPPEIVFGDLTSALFPLGFRL